MGDEAWPDQLTSFRIHVSSVVGDAVYIASADERITRNNERHAPKTTSLSLFISLFLYLARFCHVYRHAKQIKSRTQRTSAYKGNASRVNL